MTARGRGRHEEIQDGRWIVGSYEQGDPPVRIRLTWEVEGSGILWRNEMSVAGGPWSSVEVHACTPVS